MRQRPVGICLFVCLAVAGGVVAQKRNAKEIRVEFRRGNMPLA
jgi:hypothetical protein